MLPQAGEPRLVSRREVLRRVVVEDLEQALRRGDAVAALRDVVPDPVPEYVTRPSRSVSITMLGFCSGNVAKRACVACAFSYATASVRNRAIRRLRACNSLAGAGLVLGLLRRLTAFMRKMISRWRAHDRRPRHILIPDRCHVEIADVVGEFLERDVE